MINLTTAYGGSGYGSYAGIWDDTQTWILETLPSWMTGVMPIDVPEGEAGVIAMGEILDSIDPGQKVLLSARAQMALWTMLKRSADSLDRQFVATADVGGPTGETIRGYLEQQKQELMNQAQQLVNLSNAAFDRGIPEANMGEWFPEESSRTAGAAAVAVSSPVIYLVLAIAIPVAIVAVAIAGAIVWTKYLDIGQQEHELALLPDAEAKMAYLSRKFAAEASAKKDGFPWPWVIGIGAAGVGLVLLVSWAEGTLGRWVKKLSTGTGRSLYSIR